MLSDHKRRVLHAIRDNLTKNAKPSQPMLRVVKSGEQQELFKVKKSKKKRVVIKVEKDLYDEMVGICGKRSFSDFFQIAAKNFIKEIKYKG